MVFSALQFPLSISLFHTQKMAAALTSLPTHTQLPLSLLALSILTFADNQLSSTFLYTRVHSRTHTYTHTHTHTCLGSNLQTLLNQNPKTAAN